MDISLRDGERRDASVELAVRDRPLLERFSELVPFPSTITTRTRNTNFSDHHTSVNWTLCSLEARRAFMDLGLPVGRKSQIVRPPALPFSEVDYLRGVIDADGSVGFTAAGLPFVSLTTASEPLKKYFLRHCADVPGQPRVVNRNCRDGMFNPMATREAAVELATRLYSEDCLALPRKMAAALLVRQWSRPDENCARRMRTWLPEEEEAVLALGVTEAVALLGRSRATVRKRQSKLRKQQRIRTRALALRDLRLFYEPL